MSEINIIGCMDNTVDHTFESANRVYDRNGLCPTIPTCGGGNIQPKVLEVMKLQDTENMVYDDYNSRVRADQNTIGTITTNCGSNALRHGYKLIEKIPINQDIEIRCLRMVRTEEGKRLRKAYESGEIHHGFNDHREAEPREDGVCNTLTTVSKDNYLLEVKQATQKGYISCELGG